MPTRFINSCGFSLRRTLLIVALACCFSVAANATTVYVKTDSDSVPEATDPVSASATSDTARASINLLTGEITAYANDPGPGTGFGEAGILNSDRLVFQNTGTVDQFYSFSMSVDGTYVIEPSATSLSTSFIQAVTRGGGGSGGQTNSVRLQHRVSTSLPNNNLSDVTQGVGSFTVTTQTTDAFVATLMLENVRLAPGDTLEFSQFLDARAATTSGVSITDFEKTAAALALTVSNPDFTVSTEGGVESLIWVNVVPIPGAVWLFGSALGLLGWLRRRSL